MKERKGFTLAEMLTVVAIIAILLLIAMPNIANARQTSKDKNFEANYELCVSVIKTFNYQYSIEAEAKHYDALAKLVEDKGRYKKASAFSVFAYDIATEYASETNPFGLNDQPRNGKYELIKNSTSGKTEFIASYPDHAKSVNDKYELVYKQK